MRPAVQVPDSCWSEPRALSSAQLPIWRAEMLHRHTPRWTQMTVLRLRGAVDRNRLEQAIGAVVAHHPALRMRLRLKQRQAWQAFAAPAHFHLATHDWPTAASGQSAATDKFLDAAMRDRFPFYEAPLFRADLLILGPESSVLVLRLHHVAADGVALALLVPQITAAYRGEYGAREPDGAYERWLDRQARQASAPGLQAALDFYGQELAGATTHHVALYDQPAGGLALDPPDLAEATCSLDHGTCERLRALARANGATLFIVLFAAYAAVLRTFVGSSDLVIATFVSGRTGEPEPLIGTCINTVPVRLRLEHQSTSVELINAVKAGWRPVRQHQGVPMVLLSDTGVVPLAQFAINYLDMNEAPFELPGVTSTVTHAQQGFPLNDLLLYALREQDGRLRLRLIGGSGTPRLSQARMETMLHELVRVLRSWSTEASTRAFKIVGC